MDQRFRVGLTRASVFRGSVGSGTWSRRGGRAVGESRGGK